MARALNGPASSCSTTVPPWCSEANVVHCAAACMSGGAGNQIRFGPAVAAVIVATVAPSAPPIEAT